MLNHITIMGRMARDPELRRTQNGTAVTTFTLAVDQDYKGKDGQRSVDWIDVTAWRQTAELVCRYLSKGSLAIADGRLQIRDWTDKDGKNRRSATVEAENVYFTGARREDTSKSGDGAQETDTSAYGQFEELSENGELPF